MNEGMKTIIRPVKDLQQAKLVYGRQRQEATEVGGGRQVATLTDPDGNVIGLIQPGSDEGGSGS